MDTTGIQLTLEAIHEPTDEATHRIFLKFPEGTGTPAMVLPMGEGQTQEITLLKPERVERIENETLAILFDGKYHPLTEIVLIRETEHGRVAEVRDPVTAEVVVTVEGNDLQDVLAHLSEEV